MEIMSIINEHFTESTFFEPMINDNVNELVNELVESQQIKKRVGRKPLTDDERALKNAELIVKRRQYAKTYYDKKFKYVRRILEINDVYKIPENIKNLPHDSIENAQLKLQLYRDYIKSFRDSLKIGKSPKATNTV